MKYYKLFLGCVFTLFCASSPRAATFTIANGDITALVNAITAASRNSDEDIIELAMNGEYILTAAVGNVADGGTNLGAVGLPAMSGTIIIRGNGATICRGANAPKLRIFYTNTQIRLTIEDLTIRDAETDFNGAALFLGYNGTCTLKRVKFINNIANAASGGAIHAKSLNTITIENCEFTRSKCRSFGGAIYNLLSDLTITGSTFTSNECTDAGAEGGGAVFVDGARGDNGKVTIRQSVFSKNTTYSQGGAVSLFGYNRNTMEIDNCEFVENQSRLGTRAGIGFAGALIYGEGKIGDLEGGYTSASTVATSLNITNSTFFKNLAFDQGGAMWLSRATVNISNCTLASNTVEDGVGGAIVVFSGANLTLTNCTIAENFVKDGSGGGIDNSGARVSLRNTIFFDNRADNTAAGANPIANSHFRARNNGVTTDLGGNIQFLKASSAATNLPTGVRIADPLLAPLANNGGLTRTMALRVGSPAIGIGNNCPTNDQRGIARTGRCDAGAFHLAATAPTPPSNLTGLPQSEMQINLSWTDNSNDETGFKIERSTTAGTGFSEVGQVGSNITTFSNSGLQAGTTYFYRVRAFNAQGNSDYSNELRIATITGLRYVDISHQLTVYPNPTGGRCFIQVENQVKGNLQLRVFDLLGKTLIKENLIKSTDRLSHEIDLSAIFKGVFFVEIIHENYRAVKKVINY